MRTVFELRHEHENSDRELEEFEIGLYSSKELAREAIERLKDKPGFRDHPEGFKIYEFELDKDGWEEGFVVGNPNDPYSAEYDYDEKGRLVKRQPRP